MKLIIVDDNKLEREGVKNMIDWESLGIEICGLYSNGRQGLEAVLRDKPDIILSDIFMPVMDGIEMMQKLREMNSDVKVIYMTCYDDFKYAKEAININAENYIMKPIFEEELENIIKTVMNKTQAEIDRSIERREMIDTIKNSKSALTEQFFRQLVYGKIKTREEYLARKKFLDIDAIEKGSICVAYFYIGKHEAEDYEICYHAEKLIEKDCEYVCCLQENFREFILVFYGMSGDAEIYVTDYIINLKKELMRKSGAALKVGLSEISQSPLEISRLYHQASASVKRKYFSDPDEIVFYKDIESVVTDTFDEKVNTEDLYRDIKELILDIDHEKINSFINKYYSGNLGGEMYIRNLVTFTMASIQITLSEMHMSFSEILGDGANIWDKINAFNTILDIKQWIFNILDSIYQYSYMQNKRDKIKLAEDIKKFIKESYMNQFSVKEVAGHFYVSAGYANKVFKEIEGSTIFDYLTAYRIEKAKKLLHNKSKKIYEVVNEVGYSNMSHFTYIFQKNTGMTPSEYKNSVK